MKFKKYLKIGEELSRRHYRMPIIIRFVIRISFVSILIHICIFNSKKSKNLTIKIGNDPDKYFTKLLENQFLGIKNQNHIIVLNSAKGHLFIIFRIQQH